MYKTIIYLHCTTKTLGIIKCLGLHESHNKILKVATQLRFQLLDEVLRWRVRKQLDSRHYMQYTWCRVYFSIPERGKLPPAPCPLPPWKKPCSRVYALCVCVFGLGNVWMARCNHKPIVLLHCWSSTKPSHDNVYKCIYKARPHLAIHELELDKDLLTLGFSSLCEQVDNGCFISTCNTHNSTIEYKK